MIKRIGSSEYEIADWISVMLSQDVFPFMALQYQTFMGLLWWIDELRAGRAMVFVCYKDDDPVGAVWGNLLDGGEFYLHVGFARNVDAFAPATKVAMMLKDMEFVNCVSASIPKNNEVAHVLARRIGMIDIDGGDGSSWLMRLELR